MPGPAEHNEDKGLWVDLFLTPSTQYMQPGTLVRIFCLLDLCECSSCNLLWHNIPSPSHTPFSGQHPCRAASHGSMHNRGCLIPRLVFLSYPRPVPSHSVPEGIAALCPLLVCCMHPASPPCSIFPHPQGVENKKTYELNEEEINKIRDAVGEYTTEADLVGGHWIVTRGDAGRVAERYDLGSLGATV